MGLPTRHPSEVYSGHPLHVWDSPTLREMKRTAIWAGVAREVRGAVPDSSYPRLVAAIDSILEDQGPRGGRGLLMAERKKGFAPWNPKKPEILAILADIDTVLDEYRDDLPLTIRQIFYRLVGGFGYEKTEKFYSRIQDYLVLGRRSGRVPFSSIRDDGTTSRGGEGLFSLYDSPADYIEDQGEILNYYGRSWHADQPRVVALLCEAAGMVPLLERAVQEFRVPVLSSGGFGFPLPLSTIFSIGPAMSSRKRGGKPCCFMLGI